MVELLSSINTAHTDIIHDAQLDFYGRRLATASADGHVRLWDTSIPEQPHILADLDKHSGPVYQVMWSPPEVGALLASVGSDGQLLLWGPSAEDSRWALLRHEDLAKHGSLNAVSWAPPGHGAVIACASNNGMVTVLAHQGPTKVEASMDDDEEDVTQHWQRQTFQAHAKTSCSLSWASPPVVAEATIGLRGARFATVGEEGLRIWRWDERGCSWLQEQQLASTALSSIPTPARSVAWKPWGGDCEVVGVACGQSIIVWKGEQDASGAWQWSARTEVPLGVDVWSMQWADAGSVLLASCGTSESAGQLVLVKENLAREWDVMDAMLPDK